MFYKIFESFYLRLIIFLQLKLTNVTVIKIHLPTVLYNHHCKKLHLNHLSGFESRFDTFLVVAATSYLSTNMKSMVCRSINKRSTNIVKKQIKINGFI